MTSYGSADGRGSALLRLRRSRSSRILAATLTAGLTAGVAAYATTASASAATTYASQSTGRFLSGTIAGKNLDTVAGILGESAANKFGPTVVNKNSLQAELLNSAIQIPLQDGLQLPGLNVLQLGAVSQYASASPDGSALGATGAVDSNGGIGVGGSDGIPTGGATLDLSGLGGNALASLINVKAAIGAVSARAIQGTGLNAAQSGKYNIAGLKLELDLPVLDGVLSPLVAAVQPLLTTLSNSVAGLKGTVTLPDLGKLIDSAKTVSVADGAVTADLSTGTITVDVEALLKSLNLDLNNLPPNTSLVPYVVKALAELPAAISKIVTDTAASITAALGDIKIAGIDLSTVGTLLGTLTSGLSGVLTPVTTALTGVVGQLTPIFDLISSLLEIIVNGQSTANGTFTETAVELKLAGALSALNGPVGDIIDTLDSLLGGLLKGGTSGGGLDLSGLLGDGGLGGLLSGILGSLTVPTATANTVKVRQAAVDASMTKTAQAAGGKSTNSLGAVKLTSAVSAIKPAARPFAAAATDPLIQLNLAAASVTTPTANTPSSPSASPSSTHKTNPPTGVPAGQGTSGGSPALPLVLVLLTLGLAAGGVVTYRLRMSRGTH